MQLMKQDIKTRCTEKDVFNELLNLDNSNILELGCGNAELTREIAGSGKGRFVIDNKRGRRLQVYFHGRTTAWEVF